MDFPMGSVPICIVAAVYGHDATWVRAGIINQWLPIGHATRGGKPVTDVNQIDSRKGRINYYVSPKKLYEETGFLWNGEKSVDELKNKL